MLDGTDMISQMKLAEPDKEWTVKKMFVAKQSDMDVTLQWRQGKSLADVSHLD